MRYILLLVSFLFLNSVQAAQLVATCQSTRVDIKDMPHDFYKTKVYKLNNGFHQAVITDKVGNEVTRFQGIASEDLQKENMLAFEEKYSASNSPMSSQNMNLDLSDNTLQWGQYQECEVLISVLFSCEVH